MPRLTGKADVHLVSDPLEVVHPSLIYPPEAWSWDIDAVPCDE